MRRVWGFEWFGLSNALDFKGANALTAAVKADYVHSAGVRWFYSVGRKLSPG
jgi:hypothetical protein